MEKRWLSAVIALMLVCMNIMPTNVCAMETELIKGVSIMCVGESTTYGNGTVSAFRGHLYRLYRQAGIQVNFVGPNAEKNNDLPLGSGHAGYGGYYIREIADRIDPWLESYRPQVVLLTIGGNDTSQGKKDKFPEDTRETAPERLKNLALQIVQQLPETELYVASITPSANSNAQYRTDFNNAVKPLVEELSRTYSNIHFADIGASLTDLSTDLQGDKLHPTEQGYQKMAESWFSATQSVVSNIEPTEPPILKATARTGEYMLHLISPGGQSFKNAATRELTLEPNTNYEAEFYVKGDIGTAITGRVTTPDWKNILKNQSFECGPNWAKASFSFNTGEYNKVLFAVLDSSKSAGDVYIDDCSLVKGGATENLIVNPSFEEQNTGWSLNSIFEVLSQNYLEPPVSAEKDGPKEIVKEDHITMDEFDAKGGVTDITAEMIAANKFYTKPNEITMDYIVTGNQEGRNGIYYKDNDGKGYIMVNTNGSDQNAMFKLDKAGHRDFTGFDEIKIKCKMMKMTNPSSADFYTGIWAELKQYYLDVTIGDLKNYSEKINSKTVKLKPTKFTALEDNDWEEYTIKRSDFAGGALNMDGKLGRYSENSNNHDMTISFKAKARCGWLIDEISFIWYKNEPTAKITELNFTNNGAKINAYGLKSGENTLAAALYNPTSSNLENANLFYMLHNKKTGRLQEIKSSTFSLAGGETKDVSLSVTIPENASQCDYEARIIMMNNAMEPILVDVYKFDSNGAVKH